MASLKFIMDVDDDPPRDSGSADQARKKRRSDLCTSPATAARRPTRDLISFPTTPSRARPCLVAAGPQAKPTSASRTKSDCSQTSQAANPADAQRGFRGSKSPAAAAAPASPPPPFWPRPQPSWPSPSPTRFESPPGRRTSSSTTNSLMGHDPCRARSAAMCPIPRQPPPPAPAKLTPITGRVSRAKKGVPVHVCDICKPPKTYTRAEHLRRHQASHGEPRHACTIAGCGRKFHRRDLLARHANRHAPDGSDQDKPGTAKLSPPSSSTSQVPAPTSRPDRLPGRRAAKPATAHPGPDHTDSSIREAVPGPRPRMPLRKPDRPEHGTSELPADGLGCERTTASSTYSTPISAGEPISEAGRPWPDAPRGPADWFISAHPATRQGPDEPTDSYAQPPGGYGMASHLQTCFIDPQLDRQCVPRSWTRSVSPPSVAAAHGQTVMVTHLPAVDSRARQKPAARDPMTILAGHAMPMTAVKMTGCVNPHGSGMMASALAMLLQQSDVLGAIPGYTDVYWQRVHPVCPIVHRASFEAGGDALLRCAMAAVATQYLPAREDRLRGDKLHEYAWHEAKKTADWGLGTMQAILLLEFFARFRGRKVRMRPSTLFESLCATVLCHSPEMSVPTTLTGPADASQEAWQNWIDAEARRRLRTACFVMDVHTSIYQHPRRTLDLSDRMSNASPPVTLTGPSTALWEARSRLEWSAILARPREYAMRGSVSAASDVNSLHVYAIPRLDRAAILAVDILRLIRHRRGLRALSSATGTDLSDGAMLEADAEERISTIFGHDPTANTYLALHHTPLHDLLAVGGDSWLLGSRVLPHAGNVEHQKRLDAWACPSIPCHSTAATIRLGLSGIAAHPNLDHNYNGADRHRKDAAKAIVYAARAILGFLEPDAVENDGLSDYWAWYACALIVWVFCRRGPPTVGATVSPRLGRDRRIAQDKSVGGRSSSPVHLAPASSSSVPMSPSGDANAATSEENILHWLRRVADANITATSGPEAASAVYRLRGRREAVGVVSLARRRLEGRGGAGPRSKLYIDTVGALKMLEEGVNWN